MRPLCVPVGLLAVVLCPPILAADAVSTTCTRIHAVAASAISNRDKGVAKSTMKSAIPPLEAINPGTPPPQAELLRSMHEILDEVFGDAPVSESVYPIYRAELCFRRMNQKPVPASFSEVQPKLLACADLPKADQAACAMQAAGSRPDE